MALNSILKEFLLQLTEVELNLDFLVLAHKLRPKLNAILRWESCSQEQKTLVQRFLNQNDADINVACRGLYVLLSGAFEAFIRNLLERAVAIMGTTRDPSDDSGLFQKNTYWTGRALQTISDPLDYLELDFGLLARNIGTCFGKGEKHSLNPVAFTLDITNLRPRRLAHVLDRIGVGAPWGEVAKDKEMRELLGTKRVCDTNKAAEEFLQRFVGRRNRVVHQGTTGQLIEPGDVSEAIAFFRILAPVIRTSVIRESRKKSVGRKG